MSAQDQSQNPSMNAGGGAPGAPATTDQLLGIVANLQEQLSALSEIKGEHEAQQAELADREAVLSAHAEELERLKGEVTDREQAASARVVEADARLADAESKLSDATRLAEAASQAKSDSESRAAEAARVQGEMERRLTELESAAASARASEEERAGALKSALDREHKLQEQLAESGRERRRLEEALERAESAVRASGDSSREAEAQRQAVETLERQVTELRSAADEARGEAAAAAAAMVEAQASGEGVRAGLAEKDEELSVLRSELETAMRALETAGASKAEAEGTAEKLSEELLEGNRRIERLTAELAEAREEAERGRQAMASGGDGVARHLEEQAAKRIAEVERALGAQVAERDRELAEARGEIERTRTRLVEAGEHMRRMQADGGASGAASGLGARNALRRARLARYKALLHGEAEKLMEAKSALEHKAQSLRSSVEMQAREGMSQTARELEQRAAEVVEAQRQVMKERTALKRMHQRAHSRASRNSAAVCLMALVMTLSMVTGAAWLLTDRYVPATYLAQTRIAVGEGEQLGAEKLESWGVFIASALEDPQFLSRAAERMRARGFAEIGSAPDLRAELRSSLEVTSPGPGEVSLTLRGEGAGPTERRLETLATSVVGYANDVKDLRQDRAASRVIAAAAADPVPIEDERPIVFGAAAAGGSVLALVLGVVLWRRLLRSKDDFDESLDALTDRFEGEADPSVAAAAPMAGREAA